MEMEERLQFHTMLHCYLSMIQKTEGPITIGYSMKGKCKGTFQVTDTVRI
jgi:hypothetical protein